SRMTFALLPSKLDTTRMFGRRVRVKTAPFTTDSSLRQPRAVDEPQMRPSHHKFKSSEKEPASSEALIGIPTAEMAPPRAISTRANSNQCPIPWMPKDNRLHQRIVPDHLELVGTCYEIVSSASIQCHYTLEDRKREHVGAVAQVDAFQPQVEIPRVPLAQVQRDRFSDKV